MKKGLVSTNPSQELQGNSWVAERYATALSYKMKKCGSAATLSKIYYANLG